MARKNTGIGTLLVASVVLASLGFGLGIYNTSTLAAANGDGTQEAPTSRYYCTKFELVNINESIYYYFYDMGLENKIVIELIMTRSAGLSITGVDLSYNLYVDGVADDMGNEALNPVSTMGQDIWFKSTPNSILPNGTGYQAQFFFIFTSPSSPANVTIFIGYTEYY
ncbi:MAG: hypothetical protein ACFFCS_18400 [Candidatus Hodarchaeota archaeon]